MAKIVLDYLDEQITEYKNLISACEEQIEIEDTLHRSVAMMPNADVLEKIVSYESALQRQLYRSMNQLEPFQRRRLGENVPAPVVMDVSLRGLNALRWFKPTPRIGWGERPRLAGSFRRLAEKPTHISPFVFFFSYSREARSKQKITK